jgi:hypothetical protein
MNLSKTNVLLFSTVFASAAAFAQNPPPAHPEAPAATEAQEPPASATSNRAEAYFAYTMGHIAEQQYEATSRSEYATQAIEYYKKAYALDPKSPVIGERLAEMYWKAQRVHEAEAGSSGRCSSAIRTTRKPAGCLVTSISAPLATRARPPASRKP